MRFPPLLFFFIAIPVLAQVQAPAPFDRIILSGAVELRLKQGDRDEVSVPGEPDAVEVRVSGGTLVIDNTDSWRFWNKSRPKVDVQVRDLHRLIISGASDAYVAGPLKAASLSVEISGSGLVRFDALDAQELRFNISGAGDGQLAGRVGDLRLAVAGKGKVQADRLRAARAVVNIAGVGNAQVWVTENLKVGISGAGTVDYWGQPQLSRSVSGLGTINSRGDKK
jgi:hypothetical protein